MRRSVLLAAVIAALAGAAFQARSHSTTLTVFAAASLTDVLPQIDHTQRYSFAGSNTLAAQIQQGAPADVIASANLSIPVELQRKGLVGRVYVLTRNSLVLIVPRSNPARIHSVADLRKPDVKLVIAGPTVPVGSYTLRALKNLGATDVLDQVVSREADVRDVLAKVALGEADAGFVYSTDARTVRGKVKTLQLPAAARPSVAYGIAAVRASNHYADAQAWVRKLLRPPAQAKLEDAGFLPRR